MSRSSDYRFGLLMALISLISSQVFAQTISYQNPDGLSVCGSAPMEVTITNTTGNALQNATVTVKFSTSAGTDCGLVYAPGSVSGAQEGDISNLGAPVFQLQNMAAGAAVTFTIDLEAPCSVGNCIDNAEFFVNEITLNYTGGNTSITTDPYEIATALLVITQVNNYVMGGVKGDVLQRKISIINTRPAPLSSFVFTDSHQGGIEISSNQGNDISPGGNVFQLEIGGSDFAAVGDGDQLLELNESIVITENILITDCGVDISSTVSNINVGWGCNGEICQQTTVNAIVTIAESPKLPILVWEPITSVPECFCGDRPYQQGMVITNVGNGAASEITLDLLQTSPVGGGIDTASFAADSLGVPIDLTVVVGAINTPVTPCSGPPMSDNLSVILQSLAPGASVTLTWDVYFCDQFCQQPAISWHYKHSYFKECPPNPFIFTEDWIEVNDSGLGMTVILGDDATGPLQDDSTYTINYTLNYDSLALLDDELLLEIAIPCGMNWDPDNELILNGQAPGSISFNQGSEFLTITASYQLPLSSNIGTTSFDFTWDCEDLCFESQICIDSVESSCPALQMCTAPPVNIIGFDVTTTILKCGDYPPGCNLQYCSSKGLVHECPVDSICINAPPGYIAYDFEAYRANYGLPDNDNDQFADGSGQLDMNLIRKDRAIAGDTLHAAMKGIVITDEPGTTFPFAQAEIAFLGSHFSVQNQQALLSETGIVPIGGSVRIFDSSANTWYDCTAPIPTPTDDARIIYTYDLSPAIIGGCGLPANFQYSQGDSIQFEADYRINYNLKLEPDAEPLWGLVAMQPKFLVFDNDTSMYEPLNCGCDYQNIEVSGYQYNLLPGNFALPPCSPMTGFVSGTLIDLRLHDNNFFPYEYRNLLTVEAVQLQLPSNVSLLQSRISFIRFQNATSNLISNVALSPTFSNGFYHFDLEAYQMPPLEEGFSIFMQYLFEGECDIPGAIPLTAITTLDFVPGLGENPDPLKLTVTANALRPLIPILSAEAPICDLISFNNQMVLDFNFINFQTIVASQMSGPSPNTWMYFTSPTGQVTDFQIIDLTTNQPLPSSNGVFQFGSYPVGLKPFRLIATNNSCAIETVEMHFGWHCSPYTSPIQDPCYENIKLLTILSPPGEIDMLLESPSGECHDLCDTIPYHQVEVFNAQLGAVYDLLVTVLLPTGFKVIPGSSQVEYPSGSGIFYPIGDPFLPNNGAAQWNLTALVDSLANGLPGVGSAPANSITLYFLGETTCDFIANAYPLFIASAKQNCGNPSNTVAKPGDPICINGVSPPFSTNINVEAEPGFACNDEVAFDVSLTSSGTLPPGACVIATLPQGIVFVPNSCTSACPGNFNCNPVIDGNMLTWQLPAGIPSNQIVCFNFTTTGWDEVGCENGVVLFRSAVEANALCAMTGDSCSAKVSTGAIVLPYQPMRPSFDLSAFMVNANQAGNDTQVDFSINISNNGFQNEPSITLSFYLDTDGNGSGDQLVHTENILELLSNGETTTSTGSFLIPEGNLCQLMAYLDPAEQCACAGDSMAVNFPINYQTEQMPTVCSGAAVEIGVGEMPGFSYLWQPAGCLQDANAATTIFSCINDEPNPVVYDLVLEETNGTCTVNNLVSVTVQPVPGIALAESPICEGESANLVATDGISFNWQGPGITNPNLQIQTVVPSGTSDYSVTVTDAFSCSGSESVTITVNALPNADAGLDEMFCGNEQAQLNAFCNDDYDYFWSPPSVNGLPTLSNPSVCNPFVLINTSTVFTLTVTDENGCSASDEVAIGFGSNLELTLTPDFTVCLGSERLLEAVASGATGPVSFNWTPGGDCQNPACSVISISPQATTTYTVEAADQDGCAATASVTVSVTTDTIFTFEEINICEGGSAIIFGNETSQAGLYSETYNLPEGCDSTHTIDLSILPGISDTTLQTICQGDTVEFMGITFTESGVYCIGNSTNPCDSTCLKLTVLDTPNVVISVIPLADTTISPGDTALLMIDTVPFESIIWADSAGVILEECTDQFSCLVVPEASTFYTVAVTHENGCKGTALQRINIRIECEPADAQVPNAFSPNRDDTNDLFDIVAPNAERVSLMKIWDRWGEQLYEGPGPWDGKHKGKDALPDVYVYLIRVGCPDGVGKEEKMFKGDVTLLR